MRYSGIPILTLLLLPIAAFVLVQARNHAEPTDRSSVGAESSPHQRVHRGRDISPLPQPLVKPKIVVKKAQRRLELYSNNRRVRTYRIGLGKRPVGDKVCEGDRRTPLGKFIIGMKNPRSDFYLSLGLNYPNREDANRGLRDGLISRDEYDQIIGALARGEMPPPNTALGGEIFIHGNGSNRDWTWGCIALDDEDIEELYDAVSVGTPVVIRR